MEKKIPLINIPMVLSACITSLCYAHSVQTGTATGRQLLPPNEAHQCLFLISAFTFELVDFEISQNHAAACNHPSSPVTLWYYRLDGKIFFLGDAKCHLPGGNSALIVAAV